MIPADKLRIGWLEREGHHPLITTVNGPYRCYDPWKVRLYVVGVVVLAVVVWWVTG